MISRKDHRPRAARRGQEVIYIGQQIAATVIQEDAGAVGLSILSVAHMTLVPWVAQVLNAHGTDDVPCNRPHDPGPRRR